MRHATSRTLTAVVHGNRRTVAIVPGTVVDLDEVIGETDGVPLTLADALGPDLVAGCDLAMHPVEGTGAGTRSARSQPQDKTAPPKRTTVGPSAGETQE